MLTVSNICKTFGKGTSQEKQALTDISLTLQEGDFVTVIGSNGAGKSTLLSTISGAFIPDSGTIYLDRDNLLALAEYKRSATIARVFQNPIAGTSGEMTIRENLSIAMGRGHRPGLGRGKKPESVLRQHVSLLNLGLENRLDTKVSLLSGGQRQALSLLMATIKTPDLLLLDEHTSALDPQSAKTILEVTEHMVAEKHLTTLMITHNMNDAIRYGNRLVMMHRGEIVYEISGEEKQKLQKEDLLKKFGEVCTADFATDRMLLS